MIRSLAIHLPQFHSIPENDAWWGEGFTEWTNVKKAKPLFFGHQQPHIPLNDNYYDLSKIEYLRWQKEIAKSYGIHGFCFYHYWFNGKLLLEKPLELILHDKDWDMPFCLCWANENWTRTWDGQETDILMQQDYSLMDDREHYYYFRSFFSNKNYIRVEDKPVLLIYRSELLPEINATCDLWRNMAIEDGYRDLYLIRVESFLKNKDPKIMGFDASIDFQPNWFDNSSKLGEPKGQKIHRKLFAKGENQYAANKIYSYRNYVQNLINAPLQENEYKKYPCVVPSWDNSPRRQKGATIFVDSSPEFYEKMVSLCY
jgi:hypothetical protein